MQTEQFELHAQIETEHWWFRARQRIVLELVRTLVPAGTQQLVLEAGCGTGGTLSVFARDYACCGIDPSVVGIDLARQRFPSIDFRCGLAPEGVQDLWPRVRLLLLLDVLEHVEDDVGLLKKLVGALPPGGYCLVTVPADMRLWSPHDESFGHLRRYDRKMLENVCAQVPAKPIMTSYFNWRLYPMVRLARSLNAWRGRSSGKSGTDLFLPHPWINSALEGFFAGESKVLKRAIAGRSRGYSKGVSLVTILQRTPDVNSTPPPVPEGGRA